MQRMKQKDCNSPRQLREKCQQSREQKQPVEFLASLPESKSEFYSL